MNLLTSIIDRLNQRAAVGNIFDQIYGLCELYDGGSERAWVHYIGNGQAVPVTNYDAKQGTLFWAKRGKTTVTKTDSLRVAGCKTMYETRFPLTAYAVVRKNHLPCDSAEAQDWIASRVYKLVSGTDPQFKTALGVVNYEVNPNGYTNEIKQLPPQFEWASVTIEMDVIVTTFNEDGCYDTCATGDIPLPDFEPCEPCLTSVAVDGVTIIGNGTPEDPLTAIGGGGGTPLTVKDEGTNISTNTATLNFTGAGVTASLTSPGVVEVNIPSGGGGGEDLQQTTDIGNTTTNNIAFSGTAGLAFDNGSFIRKGTTDAGLGGAKGTAQICSISYELKWEAGRLYFMEQDGFTIREVTHNFTFTPTVNDDILKGFVVGSRWVLDNGDLYICSDNTSGAAVWTLQSSGGVTAVTGSAPIASSGGATPDISITQANGSTDGYLSSSDFNTFNAKQDALTAGTGIDLTGNVVTNTAPDQTVTITGGTDITVTGTYPSFTIDSTAATGMQGGQATGTDTYAVSIPGVTGYTLNDAYAIGFTNANTGASTLNINGLGAKNIAKNNTVPIIGGDIAANQQFIAIYDGTNFQILGVAPNQMFAYVTNADSVTINRGQPVYAFGATGDRMTVKLANNTSEATSSKTIGLVFSTSIAPNQKGYIITQGVVDGINTNAYSAGDTLYVGNTAGALTNTLPLAPNHLTRIGIVERANAGNGQIYVFVQNGFQLDELSDVDITTSPLANNQFLVYTTGVNNLWKNRTLGNVLGGTTSQYLRGDGSLNTFPTIPAQFNPSAGTGISISGSYPNQTFTNTAPDQTVSLTAGSGIAVSGTYPSFTIANTSAAPTIYKSTTDGTGITGVATEQITASQLIPANTFAVGDIIRVTWRVTKTGTASSLTCKLYANTSAALAGATQLGIITPGFTNSNSNGFQRHLAIKASNNTQVTGQANTFTDYNTLTTFTAANIDWTVNQYLIFMVQLSSASADVARTSFYLIEKI